MPEAHDLALVPYDDCVYAKGATDILAEQVRHARQSGEGETPETAGIIDEHNRIVDLCGRLCRQGCRIELGQKADEAGIVLPETSELDELEARTTEILVRQIEQKGGLVGILDPYGHFVKQVVETHIAASSRPDGWEVPEITDGAYQCLAEVADGNLKIILTLVQRLVKRCSELQQGIDPTDKVPPPDNPTRLTRYDVQALADLPDTQYWMRLAKIPRSELFKPSNPRE